MVRTGLKPCVVPHRAVACPPKPEPWKVATGSGRVVRRGAVGMSLGGCRIAKLGLRWLARFCGPTAIGRLGDLRFLGRFASKSGHGWQHQRQKDLSTTFHHLPRKDIGGESTPESLFNRGKIRLQAKSTWIPLGARAPNYRRQGKSSHWAQIQYRQIVLVDRMENNCIFEVFRRKPRFFESGTAQAVR